MSERKAPGTDICVIAYESERDSTIATAQTPEIPQMSNAPQRQWRPLPRIITMTQIADDENSEAEAETWGRARGQDGNTTLRTAGTAAAASQYYIPTPYVRVATATATAVAVAASATLHLRCAPRPR